MDAWRRQLMGAELTLPCRGASQKLLRVSEVALGLLVVTSAPMSSTKGLRGEWAQEPNKED